MIYKANQLPPEDRKRYPGEPIEPRLEFEGEIFTGDDKLGKLCRKLKTGTLEVYRQDGVLAYTCNIEGRAKKKIKDYPDEGLRYRKYVPFSPQRFSQTDTPKGER
jgi:hypothetical protein